jgi:hypothetical protein
VSVGGGREGREVGSVRKGEEGRRGVREKQPRKQRREGKGGAERTMMGCQLRAGQECKVTKNRTVIVVNAC